MKTRPLVSVCVPVYNGSQYLESTLISIQNQNYTNLEVVLCDDGSSDSSLIVINDWMRRSRLESTLVIHNQNLGPGAALAACVSASQGDYILCFSHDDLLMRQHVSLCMDQIQTQPNLVVVPSRNQQDTRKNKAKGANNIAHSTDWITFARLLRHNNIFAPGTLVHKKRWQPNYLGISNVSAQDWEMWLSLSLRGGFGTPTGGVKYRIHESNIHLNESTIAQEIDKSLMFLRLLSGCVLENVDSSLTRKGKSNLRELLRLGITEAVYTDPLSSAILSHYYPELSRRISKRPDLQELTYSAELVWKAFEKGEEFSLVDRNYLVTEISTTLRDFTASHIRDFPSYVFLAYESGQNAFEVRKLKRLLTAYRRGWLLHRILRPLRVLRIHWIVARLTPSSSG